MMLTSVIYKIPGKICLLLLVLCCFQQTGFAQNKVKVVQADGTTVTRYQYNRDGSPVDTNVLKTLPLGQPSSSGKPASKSTKSAKGGGMTLMSGGGGGGSYGCGLSGTEYVYAQTWYTYTLNCSTYPSTIYWVTTESGEGYSEDGINFTMQWFQGYSSGTISAYDGSYNLLGQINVTYLTPPPLTGGSITSSNASYCFSGDPGLIYASASDGGTCGGSYSFQWQSSPDGSNWSDISGAVYWNYAPGTVYATTYYRRKTTCNGSTAYTSNNMVVTINNVPAAPSIYISSGSSLLCDGASAILTSSGSNITWNAGGSGNSKSVSSAGSYVAYDNNGCGASAASNTITISTGTSPSSPSVIPGTSLLCDGATTYLSGYESVATSYDWYTSGGSYVGSGYTISGIGSGSYYLRVSNSCNAAYSSTITLSAGTSPSTPSVSAGSSLLCDGATTTLYASEPVSSSLYWYTSGGSYVGSGSSISGIGGGTYYVVASNSCNSAQSGNISLSTASTPSAPSVSASSTLLCDGATSTLYASGPGTMYWYTSGGSYMGSGGSISGIGGGTYYAVASNSCGSTQGSTITLYTDNTPSTPSISAASTLLCDGASTTMSASGTGTINWYTLADSYLGTGYSIGGIGGGSYYAIATTGCGSRQSNVVAISTGNTPSTPSVSTSSTLLCDGATATLYASGPGTMYWYTSGGSYMGSGGSISGIGGGTYYAVASNSCGSTQSASIALYTGTSPVTPSVSAGSTLLCNGATTTLSAYEPVSATLFWYTSGGSYMGSDVSMSGIGGGTYYVMAHNSCGTAYSSNITLNTGSSPSAPSVSAGTTLLCDGATTTLSATETGSIAWYTSGGSYIGSGASISGIGGGSYYAVASNSCGSAQSSTITLYTDNTPSVPSISAASSLLCNGATTTMSASGSGTINWYTLADYYLGTGSGISGIGGGSYYAVAANGCGSRQSNVITINTGSTPAAPVISAGSTLLCNGASTTLTSTGSNITWNTSATGNSISVSSAGSYSATQANSCGTSASSNVIAITTSATPAAPVITAEGPASFCSGGSVSLTSSGFGIVWSSGQTGNAITVSGAGSYYATASNSCGTSSASNTITTTLLYPPSVAAITGTASACAGAQSTLSDATAGGTWSSSNTAVATVDNNGTVTGVSEGSATIYYTVTNSCGSTTVNTGFTVHGLPSGSITPTSATFCGSGVLTASSASGYQWYLDGSPISGATAQTYTAAASGSYGVVFTNSNGCTASASNSVDVTVNAIPPQPVITPASGTAFCDQGTLNAGGSGSFQWYRNGSSEGGSGSSLTVTQSGSYTVTVTSNGCTSTASAAVSITVNTTPSAGTITGSTQVCAGSDLQLANATGGGAWSSSNTAVATIDGSGLLHSLQAGTTTISYTVSSNGCSNSATAAVTVNEQPSAPVISGPGSIAAGSSTTYSADLSGGTWSSSNTATATIGSATGNLQALAAGTTVLHYSYTSAAGCSSAADKNITVFPPLQAPVISPAVSYADAWGNGQLISSSPLSGGETGTYTLQWQYSTDSSSWQNITAATGNSYLPAGISSNTWYRLKAVNGGETVYSNIAAVKLPLHGGIIAASPAVVNSGGSSALVSVQDAAGGTGSYTYAWETSANRIGWTATTTSQSNLQQPAYYRRRVASGTDTAYSNTILVSIQQPQGTTPDNSSAPAAGTATPLAIPAGTGGADNENRNYIRTRMVSKPGMTAVTGADALSDAYDVQQSTTYFDGLGRQEQTVAWKQTPQQKDLVSIHVYDAYGREAQQYLPYTDGQDSGHYRTTASVQQPAFYDSRFGNTESYYYSNNVFEASPLNRVLQATAPGNSYTGSNRGITHAARSNALYDSVRIWNINTEGIAADGGRYLPGMLSVEETIDEQHHTVVTYTDKSGQAILKKVQLSDTLVPGHAGWLNTYYVYDDFGKLRYVLPPKAVEAVMANGWTVDTAVSNGLCFRYDYDGRGRMLLKKVPGAGEVYMIYDMRDRLVYTQDANMRAKEQWLYTDYDSLNRPVETGMLSGYSGTADDLQALMNNETSLPGGTTKTALTQTAYDGYGSTAKSFNSSVMSKPGTGNNSYAETAATTASSLVKGMPAVTKTRVIENPDDLSAGSWLETVTYYDDKGRVSQVQSDNYKSGTDITANRYAFNGQVVSSYTAHQNPAAGITNGILTSMEYDHAGRVKQVYKKINDGEEKTLSQSSYDELGMQQQKQLGTVETLNYDYNIRGWLSGMNRAYSRGSSNTGWFGMELSYDYGFDNKQYNGNIAGMQWRSKGDGERRAYGFGYDNVNRLLKAGFTQYTSGTWNNSAGVDFSVQMGDGLHANTAYDANGNILFMQQKGLKLNVSEVIDSLQYGYYASSNRLKNVLDGANNPQTTLGDFRSSQAYLTALGSTKTSAATDYSYDANGNMAQDLNKDIDSAAHGIEYNHLNLPWKVHVKNKGTITYIYDASGNKLEKQTTEAGHTTRTDYIGGYVYRNDTLQLVSHEEGRIRPKDSSYVYDYFIKDHLGNTRMVLTEERQQDIYPAATLESGSVSTEQNYYTINTGNIVSQPVSLTDHYQNNNGIPNPGNANAGNNSAVMYKLNAATGDKMGLGITLKVMSGDTVSIMGRSFWHSNGSSVDNNYSIPVNDLLLALTNPGSIITAKGYTYSLLEGLPVTPAALQGWLDNAPANGSNPKAYVNWVLLDEQMKPVTGSSGFNAVGATDELTLHAQTVNIPKNGYLYVYVSNQSDQDVFFDNLQVVHTRGPLLEETHYYPFGLTMAGISSKATGKLENRYKFNGGNELQSEEWSDGSGLEMYDAVHRLYDPQTGRFGQIDKLSELSIDFTPYGFARNNPIRMNDPLGLKEDTLQGSSSIVLAPSSRKQVASKAMNQMDYGQIAAWVDMKRQKGNSIETIQNWALGNRYLEQNTLHKLLDATTPNAIAIRDAQAEYWEASGKLYKLFLESVVLTAGGELLMLGEAGEVAEGATSSSKVVGDIIKGFKKHGIDQAISRGFKPADILKILREGKVVQAMGRYGTQLRYSLGGNTIVVNAQGKVVSMFSEAIKDGGKFIPFK